MKLKSVVAGQFYSQSPQELLDQFKTFEQFPQDFFKSPIEALFLPHAGYHYSGAIAAIGYRSVLHAPRTVVVMGPSHYLSFEGVSVFSGDQVQTPLGDLRVDQTSCDFLIRSAPQMADIPLAFAKEHSVEVHFPMIKHYFPKAQVVPIVMGQGIADSVEPLVKALLKLQEQKPFLLIASSDLSHYPSYETALQADREFLEALLSTREVKIKQVDQKIMAQKYPNYYCTHCGKEPLLALLRYAEALEMRGTRLLAYQNSGDVIGDYTRVVGYAAVGFGRAF